MITLTAKEIKELAELAGWVVGDTCSSLDDSEEYTIIDCPESGVKNDDGVIEHFRYVAYCEECPEEGVMPLGEPLAVGA